MRRENQHWIRYVEKCIENYPDYEEQIEEAWEVVRSRTYLKPESSGRKPGVSNPTAQMACANIDGSARVRRLEREYEDCRKALSLITDDRQLKLIKLRYWTKPLIYTPYGIAAELGYANERDYFRMRWQVLQIFGNVFGF